MPRLRVLARPLLLDDCRPIRRKLDHYDAMNLLGHTAASAIEAFQFVSVGQSGSQQHGSKGDGGYRPGTHNASHPTMKWQRLFFSRSSRSRICILRSRRIQVALGILRSLRAHARISRPCRSRIISPRPRRLNCRFFGTGRLCRSRCFRRFTHGIYLHPVGQPNPLPQLPALRIPCELR